MRVSVFAHLDKAHGLARALHQQGHDLVSDVADCDVLLVDHCRERKHLVDRCLNAGGRVLVYPHGARPMVDYDGIIRPDPRVTAHLAQSEGAAEVLRRIGLPCPVHVVGWYYTPVLPPVRPESVRRVVFAPVHPRQPGVMSEPLRQLNAAAFDHILQEARAHDWELTVHLWGTPADNGLPDVQDVEYVQSTLTFDGSLAQIRKADLVVAQGTYAFLAVAAGRPTVMFGQDDPPQDDLADRTVANWERYKDLLRYPLDLADGSLGELAETAREGSPSVEEWRRLFIGEPLDPEALAALVEGLAPPRKRKTRREPKPAKKIENVTALIPFLNGMREDWLEQAVRSLPGVPHLVLRNDGERAEALNQGLEQASTEFVLVFDADDVALPGFVDHLLGPAFNADVVYPEQVIADENLKPYDVRSADPFCGWRLQDLNYVSGVALIRREKALEVGGFRQLEGMSDWDLWVRMHRAGARFKPCPQARFLYRQHKTPGRVSNGYLGNSEKMLELRRLIVGDPDPMDAVRATFYAQATPATTYLRCQLPARHLPGMVFPHVMAAFGKDDGDEDAALFPDHRGAAVFQFPGDKMRAATCEVMRAQGTRVLVEVDDNYLINPGKEIVTRSNWALKIGGGQPNSRQGHRWIVEKAADGVIVTTRMLADAYRKVNPNVYVAPNSVDPADWPDPKKPDDGVFRVAWMASKSHLPDIPLVTSAFEWASRQKDVEVYVAGIDPRWKFRYLHVPWIHDLDGYRAAWQRFDVGVAPIKQQPFSVFRSDVKALEMSMGLAAPVLSDVPPYEGWDNTRCLKAQTPKEFLRAIQHLVKNRDEARQLAEAARNYALTHRTTEAQIGLWKQAVAG